MYPVQNEKEMLHNASFSPFHLLGFRLGHTARQLPDHARHRHYRHYFLHAASPCVVLSTIDVGNVHHASIASEEVTRR